MAIERRLEQVEQQNQQMQLQNQKIQRTNKRLTVGLTMMAVVVCAVVTMAATGLKDGTFDTVMANAVMARSIYVVNDAGELVVGLGKNDDGDGLVTTMSAKGKDLVVLNASDNGGLVYVYNKTGEDIVQMRADDYGNGVVGAYNRKGKGRTLQPGP